MYAAWHSLLARQNLRYLVHVPIFDTGSIIFGVLEGVVVLLVVQCVPYKRKFLF